MTDRQWRSGEPVRDPVNPFAIQRTFAHAGSKRSAAAECLSVQLGEHQHAIKGFLRKRKGIAKSNLFSHHRDS
jgi:hypothetical protein